MRYPNFASTSLVNAAAAIFVLIASLQGSLGLTAAAQQVSPDCGCNAALAKDVVSTISSDKQQYAFLDTINQQTFEEFKHDGSLLGSIPLAKGLIDISATYSDFQQKRTDYFRKVQYSAMQDKEFEQLQIVTSPVSYKYWGACMNACAERQIGLFVFKEHEDKDDLVFRVIYHGAPGAAAAKLTGSVRGGNAAGAAKGQLFPAGTTIESNGTKSVVVGRKSGATVVASVEGGGFAPPPIISEWKERHEVKGTLILFRPSSKEIPDQPVCKWSDWTQNNSNVGCDGGVCSPDRKYRASELTVTLEAPPNHVLRNAHFNGCRSRKPGVFPPIGFGANIAMAVYAAPVENGPGCEGWFSVEAETIGAGEKNAIATFKSWSESTQREFCADSVRIDPQTAKETVAIAMPVEKGDSFTFQVPDDASGAALEYTINGSSGALRPGESTSSDNLFVILNGFKAGPVTYYVYKKIN